MNGARPGTITRQIRLFTLPPLPLRRHWLTPHKLYRLAPGAQPRRQRLRRAPAYRPGDFRFRHPPGHVAYCGRCWDAMLGFVSGCYAGRLAQLGAPDPLDSLWTMRPTFALYVALAMRRPVDRHAVALDQPAER